MNWGFIRTIFLLLIANSAAAEWPSHESRLHPIEHAEPLVLHVATNGADINSGLSETEALASPAGARDRLRHLRAAGKATAGAKIVLHRGVYQLADTFELKAEDSGPNGTKVVYAAAENEKVVWSGGTTLSNWEAAGDGLWSTKLPQWARKSDGPAFRSIWIGEQRAIWAGSPEPGKFLRIEGFPDDQKQEEWTKGQRAFVYAAADAEIWKRVEAGAEVVTFTRWVDTHLRIESIDHSSRVVRFSSPNVFQLAPGDLYRIEGAAGLLDQPGE